MSNRHDRACSAKSKRIESKAIGLGVSNEVTRPGVTGQPNRWDSMRVVKWFGSIRLDSRSQLKRIDLSGGVRLETQRTDLTRVVGLEMPRND
jgi:hypothetical protein